MNLWHDGPDLGGGKIMSQAACKAASAVADGGVGGYRQIALYK